MEGGAGPIQAAGSLLQGIGGLQAGNFNAKVQRANAQNSLIEGAAQQQQIRDQARQAMGAQIASQGASGFQLGTGSNFDALEQSATNRELDLMNIRRQAQTKANGYELQAGMAKMQGRAAFANGLFGAAAAMNKGFADAAYQKSLAGGSGSGGGGGFTPASDYDVNYFGGA